MTAKTAIETGREVAALANDGCEASRVGRKGARKDASDYSGR
jgi:hypothetical protein